MPMHLDENECVSLDDILRSFNAAINEENAWALCYQCAKCFSNAWREHSRKSCFNVTDVSHVLLHVDGTVHEDTIFGRKTSSSKSDLSREPLKSEKELVRNLGCIIYSALDFGSDEDYETQLCSELEELIVFMTTDDDSSSDLERLQETDDEGIERDAGEFDGDQAGPSSLTFTTDSSKTLLKIMNMCERHAGFEADKHYQKVCRALVAEALQLANFLETVSSTGTREFRPNLDVSSCSDLDKLQALDWSRFWVQVIGELRMGVQLKKVNYNRTPIEYELTPYEILMDDIRSRRYKLKKVMVDGDIPHRVKKDAHAVILEFIRARPPLRKASERKLAPLRRPLTLREQLLDSIKRGRKLRPTTTRQSHTLPNGGTTTTTASAAAGSGTAGAGVEKGCAESEESEKCEEKSCHTPTTRRLIKVDFPIWQMDDDDDDDDEEITSPQKGRTPAGNLLDMASVNPWRRTAYDLATQCPSRRASKRRHTVVACPELPAVPTPSECHSVPQSRPTSRLSHVSTDTESSAQLGSTLPEMTWSRNSLQDELIQSKHWQEAMSLDDRLSLTLEEIVHIRSVLTKAELESLPVEGHVKEDVEKRRVCFLCLKTRFGFFGPRGQRCKLCKRTVCSKCHSKMRIPTEHFSNVPVVLLSPTLLSSPEDDAKDTFPRSLMARLLVPETSTTSHDRNTVGSAPNSPNMQRAANGSSNGLNCSSAPNSRVESRMTTSLEGTLSLPSESPPMTPPSTAIHRAPLSDRRLRMSRAKTLGRSGGAPVSERLRGLEMVVCHDCKTMVIQIIKSSRTNRTAVRNNALRNLTLHLSPVY